MPASFRAPALAVLSLVLGLTFGPVSPGALGNYLPLTTPAAAASAAPTAKAALQERLAALAADAHPGSLGIVVVDLASGERFGVNADRAYPMMSVFKAPLAATILSEVDAGRTALSDEVTITRADLRGGASRIAKMFKGAQMTFTVEALLTAAVSHSDNTAADALVKRAGGPEAVTRFLRASGIEGMRVDIDERGIEQIFSGLGAGERPPAGETEAARAVRRERGLAAFLADPRNRSTPAAAAAFLAKLQAGELLSAASTRRLLGLMYGQTQPVRLRAGLPQGARLADKCGTSLTIGGVTAAFNDIGIMSWPDGRAVVIAAFLSGSDASRAARTALFADLARAVAAALHP